jgi:hypothetical protein
MTLTASTSRVTTPNPILKGNAMNTVQNTPPRTASALLALMLALGGGTGLLTLSHEAEARQRSATFTGPNGQSASRNVSRSQGNVSSTTTGPNGQSASRNVSRTASGTEATVTGPNGQSATRSVTFQP